ncbi:MAG: hypothetical protein AB7G80_06455 [Dongiaceae bacterium]
MRFIAASVISLSLLPGSGLPDIIIKNPPAETPIPAGSYNYETAARWRRQQSAREDPAPLMRSMLGAMQLYHLLGEEKVGALPAEIKPESAEWDKILAKGKKCFFAEQDAAKRGEICSILQFINDGYIKKLSQPPLKDQPESKEILFAMQSGNVMLAAYQAHFDLLYKAFAPNREGNPDFTPSLGDVVTVLGKSFFDEPNGPQADSLLKSLEDIYAYLQRRAEIGEKQVKARAAAIISAFRAAQEIDRLLPQQMAECRRQLKGAPLVLNDYVTVAMNFIDLDFGDNLSIKLAGVLLKMNNDLKEANDGKPQNKPAPEQKSAKDFVLLWQKGRLLTRA